MEVIESPIRVLNVMESLGTGGGQVMMFELSNGLNKYFGDKCTSFVAGIKPEANKVVVQQKLLETYGIPEVKISYKDVGSYCKSNKIDVVVHHRVSISKPIRSHIPKSIPYIVVSHTAASLSHIKTYYQHADYIVSVCEQIFKCSPSTSNSSIRNKMPIILNGIENDFIKDLKPFDLKGKFKTGRCHRLVPTKFAIDSLGWFEKINPEFLGHKHYLMGAGNKALPSAAKNKQTIEYLGEITDRDLKFRYLKSLDVYFYEIFSNEGASIAVLEALACGVPVVCYKRGGIKELIRHEKTGFIEKDRNGLLKRMKQLRNNPEMMKNMKEFILKDFDERLHVRHCARKYMKLFNKALKRESN